MKSKRKIAVGDKVAFHSGNYIGLTGIVTNIDWDSDHRQAIYRVWHTVQLSNGKVGHIEKSEHWHFV